MEADKLEEFEAWCVISCIIIVFGIIFHILGLWFDIFEWFEKLCCWGLLFWVAFVYFAISSQFKLVLPINDSQSAKEIENEIGHWCSILLVVCIAMAVVIYANAKQVDRARAEQRQQFERECAQNTQSIIEKEVVCKALARDLRDKEVKIASNTREEMVGTLAIGTAIMIDGVSAGIEYPFKLLINGGYGELGSKAFQDLILAVGLYYVPYYSAIFETRLSYIYKNIFVTVCVVVMYMLFVQIIFIWIVAVPSIILNIIKFLFKKR